MINDDPQVIHQVQNAGAVGFVSKSADAHDLIKGIEHILFQGQPYFPALPQHDPSPSLLSALTPRQLQVLEMMNNGLINKQIAVQMNLSEATIKAHCTLLFKKLNVQNRTQAVLVYQQNRR